MGVKTAEIPQIVSTWAGDAPVWPSAVLSVVRAKARAKGRTSAVCPGDRAEVNTDYVRLERMLLGLGLPTQVTVAVVLLGLPGISAFGRLREVLADTVAVDLTDGTLRDNLASARRVVGLAARSRGPNVPVELVDLVAFRAFLRWALSRQPPQVGKLYSGDFYVAAPTGATIWAHPGDGGRALPAEHVAFRLVASRGVKGVGPEGITVCWEVTGGPAAQGRVLDEDDVMVDPRHEDSPADGGRRDGEGGEE